MNLHRLLVIACGNREVEHRNMCGMEVARGNQNIYMVVIDPCGYYIVPGGRGSGTVEAHYGSQFVTGNNMDAWMLERADAQLTEMVNL